MLLIAILYLVEFDNITTLYRQKTASAVNCCLACKVSAMQWNNLFNLHRFHPFHSQIRIVRFVGSFQIGIVVKNCYFHLAELIDNGGFQ